MALTKAKKQKILEELKEKIERQKIMIFVNFAGLKTKEFSYLRKKLKSAESELKVAKKTLMGIAFKDYLPIALLPKPFCPKEIIQKLKEFKGEMALVFGFRDEISPVKIVYHFSQENPNLKILGGILGNKFIEAEKIIELAKLPDREELFTKLVNSLSAPISNFLNVLVGNLKGLIFLLSQIKTTK